MFVLSRGGGGGATAAGGIDLRPGGPLYKGRAPPILQGQLITAHRDSSIILCIGSAHAPLGGVHACLVQVPRTVPSNV